MQEQIVNFDERWCEDEEADVEEEVQQSCRPTVGGFSREGGVGGRIIPRNKLSSASAKVTVEVEATFCKNNFARLDLLVFHIHYEPHKDVG